MRAIERVLVLLGATSSVVFFVYQYRMLFGDIPIGTFITIEKISPAQVTLTYGIYWVVLPGIFNAIAQGLGPVVRPAGSVPWFMIGVFSSMLTIATQVYVTWRWLIGGSYHPTVLQYSSIITWDFLVPIEVFFLILGARLLQRSWLGQGDPTHTH